MPYLYRVTERGYVLFDITPYFASKFGGAGVSIGIFETESQELIFPQPRKTGLLTLEYPARL